MGNKLHLMGGAAKISVMGISTFQSYYKIRYMSKKVLGKSFEYINLTHAKLCVP